MTITGILPIVLPTTKPVESIVPSPSARRAAVKTMHRAGHGLAAGIEGARLEPDRVAGDDVARARRDLDPSDRRRRERRSRLLRLLHHEQRGDEVHQCHVSSL